MRNAVFCVVCAGLLAGCKSGSECWHGHEDRDRFIDGCRRTAMLSTRNEDFDEHQFKYDYKVPFADENYLSFYTEEFRYTGGAHGGTHIEVGTFERKTGNRMRVADFVPVDKLSELKDALYYGAVKKLGGEYHLLNDVRVIENFYLAKDGLHFVYNEYEIAPFADGPVEVVVDPDIFRQKRDDTAHVPFSAYYSYDRKLAVKFPVPFCGNEGKRDPEDGRVYYPVHVCRFDGCGRTTIETNMCSISTSSSGNWDARTKDEHFTFVDNSYVHPEGMPKNELQKIIVRDAKGNAETIYLEWVIGAAAEMPIGKGG